MENIILADGQTTPANHTFDKQFAQAGSQSPASWLEKSSGVYAGYISLTQLVKRSPNKANKVTARLRFPRLSTDGASTLIHTATMAIDFTIPDTMSMQDRKDFLAYAKNYLGTAIATAAIVDGQPAV